MYISPFKVALMSIIRFFCRGLSRKMSPVNRHEFLLELIKMIKQSESHVEPSISELVQRFKQVYIDNLDFLSVLLSNMGEMQTVDELSESLNLSRELLLKFEEEDEEIVPEELDSMIDASSCLGLFIRRCLVSFDKMPFEDQCILLENIRSYCRLDGKEAVVDMDRGNLSREPRIYTSFEESAKYIETQIVSLNQSACLLEPRDLQKKLKDIWEHFPGLPKVHYTMYLNALRIRDFELAQYHLNRFFNYGSAHKIDDFIQHYALLEMAYLYWSFGYTKLALQSINEAIHSARIMHDISCLNYSLSWLDKLDTKFNSSENDCLVNFDVKALTDNVETDMRHLAVVTTLARIKNISTNDKQMTDPLSTIFYLLAKSGASAVAKSFDKSRGIQLATEAAVWRHYGKFLLSSVYNQLQLGLYDKTISSSDAMTGFCNLAKQYVEQGLYYGAENIMKQAKKLLPTGMAQFNSQWLYIDAFIQFERSLHREEWQKCELLLLKMDNRAHDSDSKIDCAISRARLLAKMSDYSRALDSIEKAEINFAPISPHLRLNVMLTKACIYLQSGTAYKATILCAEIIEKAQALKLQKYILRAHLIIGRIHLLSDRVEYSESLVNVVMPAIMTSPDLELQSLTFELLGDIYFQHLKNSDQNTSKQEFERKSSQFYDMALTGYRKLESLSGILGVLKLKAIMANFLGDVVYRDSLSCEFRKIVHECQISQ